MFKTILIASAIAATLSTAASAGTLSCNPAIQNWLNGSHTTCTVVDQNSNDQQNQKYSPPSDTRPELEVTSIEK